MVEVPGLNANAMPLLLESLLIWATFVPVASTAVHVTAASC